MVYCAYINCRNHTTMKRNSSEQLLRFFRCPLKDEKLLAEWTKRICPDKPLTSSSRVCSVHFTPSHILGNSEVASLRLGAVPFQYNAPSTSVAGRRAAAAAPAPHSTTAEQEVDVKPDILQINLLQASADPLSLEPPPPQLPDAVRAYINSLQRRLKAQAERITMQRRKIDNLMRNRNRHAKKIAGLTENLRLSEERLQHRVQKTLVTDKMMSRANPTGQALFKRYITTVLKPPAKADTLPRRAAREVREFATNLYRYSRLGYIYVRRTLQDFLPHERTVMRWLDEYNKVSARMATEAIESVLNGAPEAEGRAQEERSTEGPDQEERSFDGNEPGEDSALPPAPITTDQIEMDDYDELAEAAFNEMDFIEYCPDEEHISKVADNATNDNGND